MTTTATYPTAAAARAAYDHFHFVPKSHLDIVCASVERRVDECFDPSEISGFMDEVDRAWGASGCLGCEEDRRRRAYDHIGRRLQAFSNSRHGGRMFYERMMLGHIHGNA